MWLNSSSKVKSHQNCIDAVGGDDGDDEDVVDNDSDDVDDVVGDDGGDDEESDCCAGCCAQVGDDPARDYILCRTELITCQIFRLGGGTSVPYLVLTANSSIHSKTRNLEAHLGGGTSVPYLVLTANSSYTF